jgi:predicted Zn finger-like uncharacterized protein
MYGRRGVEQRGIAGYSGGGMGDSLDIRCPQCGAEYTVGGDLAGHRVKCAHCEERFEIESLLTGAEGGEPEGRSWRFRMPGGQGFGPLSKYELDEYLFEGILTADCQILQEGDESWQWAGGVYPEVPDAQSDASKRSGATDTHCGGLASAGLLYRIPNIRDSLPSDLGRSHDIIDALARQEAEDCKHAVRFLGSRTIGLVQSVNFEPRFATSYGAVLPQRSNVMVNSLAIAGFEAAQHEFYLLSPHSNLVRLPHEFFAILPGTIPASLVWRAGGGDPVWLGHDRSSKGAGASAMRRLQTSLGAGANWKWVSRDKKQKIQLEWTVQMVPLGSEQFMLIAQTSMLGRRGRLVGLDWFREQIDHALNLEQELNFPGGCEARFPMHSESAELLARMFGDV